MVFSIIRQGDILTEPQSLIGKERLDVSLDFGYFHSVEE